MAPTIDVTPAQQGDGFFKVGIKSLRFVAEHFSHLRPDDNNCRSTLYWRSVRSRLEVTVTPSLVVEAHPAEDLLAQVCGEVLPPLLAAQVVDAAAAAVLGLGESPVGRARRLVLQVHPAGAELDLGPSGGLCGQVEKVRGAPRGTKTCPTSRAT